jgi:hypothetical protein
MARMSKHHAEQSARLAYYERERRTAACIKACEGIPTETLEGGFKAINAELLEALKCLRSLCVDETPPTRQQTVAALYVADEAISKAEGSDE